MEWTGIAEHSAILRDQRQRRVPMACVPHDDRAITVGAIGRTRAGSRGVFARWDQIVDIGRERRVA